MTLVIVSENPATKHVGRAGVFGINGDIFATAAPLVLVDDAIREYVLSEFMTITVVESAETILVQTTDNIGAASYAEGLQAHLLRTLHPHFVAPLRSPDQVVQHLDDMERHADHG